MPGTSFLQALPWVLTAVLALAVVILAGSMWLRRAGNTVDEAVLEALHRMSKAATEVRGGLDQDAADHIAMQLVELLKCVAVGITDSDGTLLSWDGEATTHYVQMRPHIQIAVRHQRRAVMEHDKLECREGSACRMRTAVVLPIVVDGQTESVLIVVGRTRKRLVQLAGAVAHYVTTQFEQARVEESNKQRQQAEFRALRAQISPHFTYNALNTIAYLINSDPERARDLLHEFADFSRYSFRSSGMFTTLSEEMRNVDRFLTIEAARFEDKLRTRMRLAPEVSGVAIPFLIVQPLVENALHHGLLPKPNGGTLTVTAQDNGSEALVTIEDDGVGMDPGRLQELRGAHNTGEHVGLGNVNQRMRQLYGDEYALQVETAPGAGMKVTLRVPKFARGVQPSLPDYKKDGPAPPRLPREAEPTA